MKIVFLPALILLSATLHAQPPDGITFKSDPKVLVLHGDQVPVNIQIDFQPGALGKKSALLLKPLIRYDGVEVLLEPVLFTGEKVPGAGQKVTCSVAFTATIHDTAGFISGMEIAELVVQPFLLKKAGTIGEHPDYGLLASKAIPLESIVVAGGVIMTGRNFLHTEKVTYAPHKCKGNLTEGRLAMIFFDKESAALNFSLPMNQVPFVQQQLEHWSTPVPFGWRADSVVVMAYTSPEGDSVHNRRLAERRLEKGLDYVNEKLTGMQINPDGFPIITRIGGEDWEGFAKTLKGSNLEGKGAILDLIETQPDKELRMNELMQQASLYKEVENTFLPMLRRISITLYLSEIEKTEQQLVLLADANPELLRFDQLMFAGSLAEELDDKLKIFLSATSLFPNEWEAYNNAAAVFLEMVLTERAMVYLNQALSLFPRHGIILNNLAVASLQMNNAAKAKTYLEMAETEGVSIDYNYGLYFLLTGEYGKALEHLSTSKCDFNAALAWLMSGQTDKALNTLICAEESSERFYLMAVCEARLNNLTEVISYLKRSIELQPGIRERIFNDAEFLRFFSNPDFNGSLRN
jgi:tetratricopeptide (TPR) repeat protein